MVTRAEGGILRRHGTLARMPPPVTSLFDEFNLVVEKMHSATRLAIDPDGGAGTAGLLVGADFLCRSESGGDSGAAHSFLDRSTRNDGTTFVLCRRLNGWLLRQRYREQNGPQNSDSRRGNQQVPLRRPQAAAFRTRSAAESADCGEYEPLQRCQASDDYRGHRAPFFDQ